MKFLENMAHRLREIRTEMRLTQKEMGEIMGVSRASYSLYENGKLPIDVIMLDRLHQKTGLPADYLLGYTDIDFELIPQEKIAVIGSPEADTAELVLDPDMMSDLFGAPSKPIPFSTEKLEKIIANIVSKEFDKRGAKSDETL